MCILLLRTKKRLPIGQLQVGFIMSSVLTLLGGKDLDEWMDGCTGETDGRTDRWTDGWIDRQTRQADS